MEIIQYSNGPEGARNSSKQQNVGIQMPDNDSYERSLYIAAIQEAYGYVGLASPVMASRDGVKYEFDFYHPDEQQLLKVFKQDDMSELEKYAQYPGEKVVIVDVEGCEFRVLDSQCDDEPRLCIPEKIGRPVANMADACIFFDQRLWKLDEAFKRAVNFNQDRFRIERTVQGGAWSVWRPLSVYVIEESEE